MQSQSSGHQAPDLRWNAPETVSSPDREADREIDALRARIDELERIVHDYEVLLEALPDVFERKFQQRLEPLMERYRLLAEQQLIKTCRSSSVNASQATKVCPCLDGGDGLAAVISDSRKETPPKSAVNCVLKN